MRSLIQSKLIEGIQRMSRVRGENPLHAKRRQQDEGRVTLAR